MARVLSRRSFSVTATAFVGTLVSSGMASAQMDVPGYINFRYDEGTTTVAVFQMEEAVYQAFRSKGNRRPGKAIDEGRHCQGGGEQNAPQVAERQ